MNDAHTLTEAQREVAVHLLGRVWRIAQEATSTAIDLAAEAEAKRKGREQRARWRADQVPRDLSGQYNVFAINGGRGTGKTTLLRRLREIIPFLGIDPSHIPASDFAAFSEPNKGPGTGGAAGQQGHKAAPATTEDTLFWGRYPQVVRDLAPKTGAATLMSDWFAPLPDHARGAQRVALALPIIDPSQFESDGRTVMEQVLAHLTHVLRENSGPTQDADRALGARWREHAETESEAHTRAKRFSNLVNKDAAGVARGWVYAQSFGQKMIATDSASFDEYVAARAKESVFAALRHRNWRALVDETLDAFEARLLVICIDDCDLTPSHTLDVLDAIRIYLNSRRMVVIMATEQKMLEHNLKIAHLRNLKELEGIFASPLVRDEHALEFLQMVDRGIDEAALFLGKIVPVPNRYYLDDVSPSFAERILREAPTSAIDYADRLVLRRSVPDLLGSFSLRDLAYVSGAIENDRTSEQLKSQGSEPPELERSGPLQRPEPPKAQGSLYGYLRSTTTLDPYVERLDGIETFAGPIAVELERFSAGVCNVQVRLARSVRQGDKPPKSIGGQWPSQRLMTSRTQEPRHDWDELRTGQMAIFLTDHRRCDLNLYRYDINLAITTARDAWPLSLPPTLLEDVRSLLRRPLAPESELTVRPGTLPRNCRFVGEALRLLSSDRLRRAGISPKRVETIATLPLGKLAVDWSGRSLLDLLTDANFVVDKEVAERIAVAAAAINLRIVPELGGAMPSVQEDLATRMGKWVKDKVQPWYDQLALDAQTQRLSERALEDIRRQQNQRITERALKIRRDRGSPATSEEIDKQIWEDAEREVSQEDARSAPPADGRAAGAKELEEASQIEGSGARKRLQRFAPADFAKRLLEALVASSEAIADLKDVVFLHRAREGERSGNWHAAIAGLPAFSVSDLDYQKLPTGGTGAAAVNVQAASGGAALTQITATLNDILTNVPAQSKRKAPAEAQETVAEAAADLLDLLIACLGPAGTLRTHMARAAIPICGLLQDLCGSLADEKFPFLGGIKSDLEENAVCELLKKKISGYLEPPDPPNVSYDLQDADIDTLAAFLGMPHALIVSTLAKL